MQKIYCSLLFIFLTLSAFAQNIASFENFNLPVDTFLNNADSLGRFQSGDAFFPNTFSPDFGGFWASGWAVSTMRDDTTSGFGNLYSAITGSGSDASTTYAIGQQNAMVYLQNESIGKVVEGLYLTNTTYAHNSMRDGDDFAKKFGGESGDDPDFFKLTVQKYSNGTLAPQTVEFYLADFRSSDNNEDYIVNDWQWVDLSNLGNVDSLQFTLSSSDLGNYGINTPLFFALDNLTVSEEISTSTNEELLTSPTINVYPNPAINELTVDLANLTLGAELRIFDLLGRQLLQQATNVGQNTINVAALETGTYILQITSVDGLHFSTTFLKY